MTMKKITTETEYRSICAMMDDIIAKGTALGDMEALPQTDKDEYMRLSLLVREWEKIHYAFPLTANPLIRTIQERMVERNLKQRDTAALLGINESRMSDILKGKRSISMRIAKRLRKELDIPVDLIIDNA